MSCLFDDEKNAYLFLGGIHGEVWKTGKAQRKWNKENNVLVQEGLKVKVVVPCTWIFFVAGKGEIGTIIRERFSWQDKNSKKLFWGIQFEGCKEPCLLTFEEEQCLWGYFKPLPLE